MSFQTVGPKIQYAATICCFAEVHAKFILHNIQEREREL